MEGQDGRRAAVVLLLLIIGYRSFNIFLIFWLPGKNVVVRLSLPVVSFLVRGVYCSEGESIFFLSRGSGYSRLRRAW